MVVRLSVLRTGRLTPRKCSWYSFLLETVSTAGPKCDRKDFMSIKPATFRFVAQHLNHCATAVPQECVYFAVDTGKRRTCHETYPKRPSLFTLFTSNNRVYDFEALRIALLQAINRFNHITVSSLLIIEHLGATTKVDQ